MAEEDVLDGQEAMTKLWEIKKTDTSAALSNLFPFLSLVTAYQA